MARINSFKIKTNDLLAKYKVITKIGSGWEGEVFLVKEKNTGIYRGAKLFYPHRDKKGTTTRFTARKLHKLRNCPVLIQYHHQQDIVYQEQTIKMLVSEYVEGVQASKLKKLSAFEALHLLKALAEGMACVHEQKEYHGDIHENNVLVKRKGASFEVKLLDLYNYGPATADLIAEDVVGMIQVFRQVLRGPYIKQPLWVKNICCGMKHSLIKKKFKNAQTLLKYINSFAYE